MNHKRVHWLNLMLTKFITNLMKLKHNLEWHHFKPIRLVLNQLAPQLLNSKSKLIKCQLHNQRLRMLNQKYKVLTLTTQIQSLDLRKRCLKGYLSLIVLKLKWKLKYSLIQTKLQLLIKKVSRSILNLCYHWKRLEVLILWINLS